jgi:hypothetical protein
MLNKTQVILGVFFVKGAIGLPNVEIPNGVAAITLDQLRTAGTYEDYKKNRNLSMLKGAVVGLIAGAVVGGVAAAVYPPVTPFVVKWVNCIKGVTLVAGTKTATATTAGISGVTGVFAGAIIQYCRFTEETNTTDRKNLTTHVELLFKLLYNSTLMFNNVKQTELKKFFRSFADFQAFYNQCLEWGKNSTIMQDLSAKSCFLTHVISAIKTEENQKQEKVRLHVEKYQEQQKKHNKETKELIAMEAKDEQHRQKIEEMQAKHNKEMQELRTTMQTKHSIEMQELIAKMEANDQKHSEQIKGLQATMQAILDKVSSRSGSRRPSQSTSQNSSHRSRRSSSQTDSSSLGQSINATPVNVMDAAQAVLNSQDSPLLHLATPTNQEQPFSVQTAQEQTLSIQAAQAQEPQERPISDKTPDSSPPKPMGSSAADSMQRTPGLDKENFAASSSSFVNISPVPVQVLGPNEIDPPAMHRFVSSQKQLA